MSAFIIIVILGFLMIVGGVSMAGSPMITFSNAGYFIIALFLIAGVTGIVRGIYEKRYNKDFVFSILSLILGIAGFVVPGATAMDNNTLLYMASAWLFVHGILSIISAVDAKNKGGSVLVMIIGILLGALELYLCVYSATHPAALAANIGYMIGLYYIVYGIHIIFLGSSVCKGANNLSIVFTVIGILIAVGGLSLMFTPLNTFINIGYAIILLFFINGMMGIIRAVYGKTYDRNFWFAIISTVLGVIGFAFPQIADVNGNIILYIAAAWFLISAVLSIIKAVNSRKEGASMLKVVIEVIIGVADLGESISYIFQPRTLALNLGLLVGFCFITSGIRFIVLASDISKNVAKRREEQISETPAEA